MSVMKRTFSLETSILPIFSILKKESDIRWFYILSENERGD